jgi:hypothetical protein
MAKKTKALTPKCPETIYGYLEEEDGDLPYLVVSEDPSDLVDIEGECVVGVYTLDRIVTLKNFTEVEER